MTSNSYTPDEAEVIDCYAGLMEEQAGENYDQAKADAERGIAKIKADAVRGFAHEMQRGLDREHPRLDQDELSTRITLIAEADAYAQRIEEGA